MNKSMTRLVVALIAFLLVAVVAVPIVQGVINNKQSTDIGGGKDGKDGEDGITPQLRINYSTNEWEYSYTQGVTWQSLGVKATGAAGKDGADGVNGTNGTDGKDGQDGQDGKDGVSPRIRINTSTSEWEISTDEGLTWESTGVKASGEVMASLTIDSEFSETSENPVQNKVITTEMMAFVAEINMAFDEVYAALDNVSVTVPTFDLVALGLPVLSMDGTSVELVTDTTEIIAALDKGPVKFIISMDNGDSTSTNVEVVTTSMFGGESYICVYSTPSYDLFFVIYNGGISLGAFINNIGGSSLPEVSTEDDGKGLIVQNGEWVVGELPETPTQEKTIEITESGTYEITPDAGYALSKVLMNINIASAPRVMEYLPETTFTNEYMADLGAFVYFVPIETSTMEAWMANQNPVIVVYDGEEYVITPQVVTDADGSDGVCIGNLSAFGGTGNGEPFAVVPWYIDGLPYFLIGSTVDTTATKHTIRIYQNDFDGEVSIGDEWISAKGSFRLDTQGTYTVSHGLGVIPDIVLVNLSVAGAVENESSGWFLVQSCNFSDNLLGSAVQETNNYGSVFLFSPLNKSLMNGSANTSLEKLVSTQFGGICNVTDYSMQIGTDYVSLLPGYSYSWVAYAKKPADA